MAASCCCCCCGLAPLLFDSTQFDSARCDSIPIGPPFRSASPRQAITRIAESLAKMALQAEATQEHVQEAIRLFKVSTLSAAQSKTFEEMGLGA
jgi:hypothetical protein